MEVGSVRIRTFVAALSLLVAGVGALAVGSQPVAAHVHGITPLLGCSVDNPNSGANGTNGTAADDANGGPITGVIPIETGSAPLTVGDGGFGAATGNCP